MTQSLEKWEAEGGSVVLYRGDCRDVLPFVKADAVVTDPPYLNLAGTYERDFQGASVES